MDILSLYIQDKNILALMSKIVASFSSTGKGVGLPLGNLTSQLLVNIYMNEFDQFVKHRLKAKYYIRYADDFVIMSPNREWLIGILPLIRKFLSERLKLQLHPNKVSIRTVASGVDYLGWVHFPDHRVLRTATKRRMLKAVSNSLASGPKPEALASYLGMLKHGNAHKLSILVSSSFDFFAPCIKLAISLHYSLQALNSDEVLILLGIGIGNDPIACQFKRAGDVIGHVHDSFCDALDYLGSVFDGDEGLVDFLPEKGLYMSLECGQTNGALASALFLKE